jgi:BirA family biotin operon repressor/biotin-[acetyl-CoA-carboxylase] ligase
LWWSPKGCLTVTFVWPIEEQLQPQQVPLLVGVALRRAAVELTGEDSIQLKWPNDLLYKDRKLAGVLCERIERCDLIGIGVNVCNDLSALPKGLRERATSLSIIAGRTIGVTDALLAVAKHLHAMLSRDGDRHFRTLLEEYDRHHALIGRTVTITTSPDEPAVRGVAQGLDSHGRLLLKHRGGVEKIISGQVNLHAER